MIMGLNLGQDRSISPLAPHGLTLVRERAYAVAGLSLAPVVTSDTVVALPEIGAFGYYSNARILDAVGLVSPKAVSYYPVEEPIKGNNVIPPRLIEMEQPDYIVGLDQYFQLLEKGSYFQHNYKKISRFDARLWGSSAVVVYQKILNDGVGIRLTGPPVSN
jgi:hypothetical protein